MVTILRVYTLYLTTSREEKILVKGIFEEKRSLDGIILLFRNIDQKKLLDSQVALIERHKNLEVIIETCLAALDKQEQKIIKLTYSECLTNYSCLLYTSDAADEL